MDDKKTLAADAPKGLLPHFIMATSTTLIVHPFRILLNQACLFTSPLPTLLSAKSVMFQGFWLNMLRGASSTTVALQGKSTIQTYFGEEAPYSNVVSALALGVCGAGIATLLETPFIRATLRKPEQAKHLFPASYFSRHLTGFYFLRDFSFAYGVLGASEMESSKRAGVNVVSTIVNSGMQRLITLEAGKDMLGEKMVPDYKKGFQYVIKSFAQGGVYKHPIFTAPYQQPTSLLKKTINVMSALCGPNIFFFRLTYTYIFCEVLLQSRCGVNWLEQKYGLFSKQQVCIDSTDKNNQERATNKP